MDAAAEFGIDDGVVAPVSSSSVAEFPFTLASIKINECTERNGKRTLSVRAQLGEESRASAISITTEVRHRSVKEAVRVFTGRDRYRATRN